LDREVIEHLREYVIKLQKSGIPIKSLILFGSRAKGTHLRDSDVDILIILERSNNDFLSRVSKLMKYWDWRYDVDIFPYTIDEVKKLMNKGSITIYDALEHGIIIFDDGTFSKLRERFNKALSEGIISKDRRGWWKLPLREII